MEQKIRNLIKQAMIEKDKDKQTVYKSILENAQKIAKNDMNRFVNDGDFVKALRNEIKAMNDLKAYVNEDDPRYKIITKRIYLCTALLPRIVSEEEVYAFLKGENIEKTMGACMKACKVHFKEAFDGRAMQSIVKDYIDGIAH